MKRNLIVVALICFTLQLLGKECYDIDIALDNMLGSEFANKVAEYVASTGEKPPSGLGVIPRYAICVF